MSPPARRPAEAARDIPTVVREIVATLPDAVETVAHGSSDWKVRGRSFATLVINHHGDGRIALYLAAAPGQQAWHVERDPDGYFVPPYVGPRGWLGVNLDRRVPWPAIVERLREAWCHVAPRALAATLGPAPAVAPPTMTVDPEVFDPLSVPAAQAVLARIGRFCLALPETTAGTQFGDPVWKVGKKSFASLHRRDRRLRLHVKVEADLQAMLCADPRYAIPPYIGGNGWIALDLERRIDWDEVRGLLLGSWRHFALARQLRALGPDDTLPAL